LDNVISDKQENEVNATMSNVRNHADKLPGEMPDVLDQKIGDNGDDPAVLKSLGWYNKVLGEKLPKKFFQHDQSRIKWFFIFTTLSWGAFAAIVMNPELPFIIKAALGLIIGGANGGNVFLAHELLHGAILKNTKAQTFISFLQFMPLMISPTFWKYWHNRLHHGKTQKNILDPDAFPTLAVYKRTKSIQRIFAWTPGSGYLRSYTYFFFWFTYQAFTNQLYLRFSNRLYNSCDHKKVTFEFYSQVLFMVGMIYLAGPAGLLFAIVIPFLVQNYIVMSYISTNHNLSPLTKVNDPLVNSLNVTNNKFFNLIHLNFGYHAEHHIFPKMSARWAPEVNKVLKEDFPNKFKEMPKWKAIKLLYSTPRIYNNSTELIHPETLEVHKTI
jgi:fatty acid desaturase